MNKLISRAKEKKQNERKMLRAAPKEARQTIRKNQKVVKRIQKHDRKRGKADGAYLRHVPWWLDWAIPWGGLRLGKNLYVAGWLGRAQAAGYLHMDRYQPGRWVQVYDKYVRVKKVFRIRVVN